MPVYFCILFFPGLNPNPKSAADLRKNEEVLRELNRNHEDDMFPTQKVPISTTFASLEKILGALNNFRTAEILQESNSGPHSLNSSMLTARPLPQP